MPYFEDLGIRGLIFETSSQEEIKDLTFDIKKVDLIFNPEFRQDYFLKNYALPIFYKSAKARQTLFEIGVDTGREVIPL